MNILKLFTNYIYNTFVEIKETIYYTHSEISYYFYVKKTIIRKRKRYTRETDDEVDNEIDDEMNLNEFKKCKLNKD